MSTGGMIVVMNPFSGIYKNHSGDFGLIYFRQPGILLKYYWVAHLTIAIN